MTLGVLTLAGSQLSMLTNKDSLFDWPTAARLSLDAHTQSVPPRPSRPVPPLTMLPLSFLLPCFRVTAAAPRSAPVLQLLVQPLLAPLLRCRYSGKCSLPCAPLVLRTSPSAQESHTNPCGGLREIPCCHPSRSQRPCSTCLRSVHCVHWRYRSRLPTQQEHVRAGRRCLCHLRSLLQ